MRRVSSRLDGGGYGLRAFGFYAAAAQRIVPTFFRISNASSFQYLDRAGKRVSLILYPGGEHHIAGNHIYLYLRSILVLIKVMSFGREFRSEGCNAGMSAVCSVLATSRF